MKKLCPTCKNKRNIEKFFWKNKSRKDGFQRECKICCKQHSQKHYWAKRSPRLKENLKEGYKVCTHCKKELPLSKFKPSKKGRFKVNSNCKVCFNKLWNDYQRRTGQNNNYQRLRKLNDPLFKLKNNVRLRVNEVLKRNNITKNHSGLKYLGCDVKIYKKHLESKFTKEMTWDNHGKYWEVDHIQPLILVKNVKDCYKYFNYKNTQPLTISDNRQKGSNIYK